MASRQGPCSPLCLNSSPLPTLYPYTWLRFPWTTSCCLTRWFLSCHLCPRLVSRCARMRTWPGSILGPWDAGSSGCRAGLGGVRGPARGPCGTAPGSPGPPGPGPGLRASGRSLHRPRCLLINCPLAFPSLLLTVLYCVLRNPISITAVQITERGAH